MKKPKPQSTNYSVDHLSTATKVMRAINHPLRQSIIDLLWEKELQVTEIYETLKLKQSVCSQQLAILRIAKIVTERRDGIYKYYFLAHDRLEEVNRLIKSIAEL